MSMIEPPDRARSLEAMDEIASRTFVPVEIEAAIAAYRPRPDDIIISPFAKCGTTWLQQTFHCLRTGGDMDFDDISWVVPWIEVSGVCGQDLEAPQRAAPRGFKSHLAYDAIPKGARYVVSLRDPADAMLSLHQFMEAWYLEPGAVSFEDFARSRSARTERSYWSHLVSWWRQRDNPDVLLMSYEGMLDAPEAAIRRLAAFAHIPLDKALLDLTLKQSSRAFMLAHQDRYEDAMIRRVSEARGALPAGCTAVKVRPAAAAPAKSRIPPKVAEMLEERWRETVTAEFGFETYAALERELRQRGRQEAI